MNIKRMSLSELARKRISSQGTGLDSQKNSSVNSPKQIKVDSSHFTIVEVLQICEKKNVLCLIEYVNLEDKVSSRFIQFYGLRTAKKGGTLIVGKSYRTRKDGIRTFRLERVLTAQMTLLPCV